MRIFIASNVKPETVISADHRTKIFQYLADLWHYRDLFWALVERDVKVRYKQTVLGVLWVIVPPLLLSGVFSIIFVRVVKMPTQDLPAPLFFLAALIPWTCFSNGLSQAAGSMESGAGLISKVYFPRLIVPGAMLLATVVDFVIGWVFFNIVAILWTYFPSLLAALTEGGTAEAPVKAFWTWKFIPFTVVLLCLQLCTAMGIGVVLAVLNAQYRDVRYVTPMLVQFAFWVTPVVWPVQRFLETRYGDSLNILLYLNPMAGVIETYRALLAEGSYIPFRMLAANFCVAAGLLAFGIWFFRKREQRLVDFL